MSSRTRRSIPPANIRAEYDFRLKKIALLAPRIAGVLTNLIKWGGLAAIMYFVYCCVVAVAGRQTDARILFGALLDMSVSEYAAYVLGGGGVIYGVRERRLRRKTTERLSKRTAELEKRIDPKRTSSGLPPTGNTRPEDI